MRMPKKDFPEINNSSKEEIEKEFVEFLHTKGVKAKYSLVVENIKNGAKAAPHNTAAQIAKVHAQTQKAIAQANAYGNPKGKATTADYSADSLAEEFNAFLKSKGLDGKYTVVVTEEE